MRASVRKRKDRPNKPWEACWDDPARPGKMKTKCFALKRQADAHIAEVRTSIDRGTYIDPAAGKTTLAEFAGDWLARQTVEPTTREAMESRLRNHIIPALGDYELRAIRPSIVQAWVKALADTLAPRTVQVILTNLSSILGAAVEDDLIAKNPCRSKSVSSKVRKPENGPPIIAWSVGQVAAVIAALPPQWKPLAVIGAQAGLRQGEIFGLRTQDVNFLKRRIEVTQQVRIERSTLTFAPPKGGKTRSVFLSTMAADALSARLAEHGPGPDGLFFFSRERKPLNRNYINPAIWKPALVEAGIEPTRENGMHALRHHFASVMIQNGVAITEVSAFLGHSTASFTLKQYGHMLPDSEDRGRTAMDAAWTSREPGVSQEAR